MPEDRAPMPTYQYACTNATCGNRFELVQAFTDPSVTECPVCGRVVRKVYGSVGVVFKGSGFYRTDSRAEKTAAHGQKSSDRERVKADASSSESSSSKSTAAASDAGSSSNGKSRSSHASDSGSARSAGSGSAAKTAAAT
jgi:putative FmdB family regulatory protein